MLDRVLFSRELFSPILQKGLSLTKKRREKPRREITRRQLSQWQQHRKRQRIILGLGIFIITVVLGIVGAGWYTNQYQPLRQTVITVNDTSFNMGYYIKMLKLYGEGQASYYMYAIADEVVTIIERNELIRQGALKLDISVNRSEVDEELKSRDPPLSKDYRDLVRTEMLIDKLQDEYFEQEVPVYAEQRHIMAMLLESESQATEVKLRLEGGESFAELAGELSLESLSQAENGDLGWRPKDVLTILLGTSVIDGYAFSSEVGVLSQPLYDEEIVKGIGYWLIKVVDRNAEPEEADVLVILLGSEQEAQEVRTKLEAGEDFATLAQEFSQHESKDNGGEVNSVTPGMMSLVLSEFIFNSEIELGVVSEPIRDDTTLTKGGYWLIKVLDKDDNRQIEESDRGLLKAKAFTKWVEALWDDPENKIESYLDAEKKAWAIEKAVRG